MTNPTFERAARAAAEVYFGPDVAVKYPPVSVWTDVARAVLMAVLPELQRWNIQDEEGSMMGWCQYPVFDGDFVRYDDLTAILAEGE